MPIDPKLLLPKKIYALPGSEINIYFQNIITVINPANYAFDISCKKGRCDSKRWRWTPTDQDTGTYPMKVSVWSDEGLLAEAEAEIIVSPRDAGKGKKINFLYIGASCTVSPGHADELFERFQRPENPTVTMLGSRAPGYKDAIPGGPAIEAYGGWSWRTYFQKEKTDELDNDGLHPRRPYDVPSPFLFDKNGKKEFDAKAYIDTICHGNKPDILFFELGVNDVFCAKSDEEIETIWQTEMYPYMKKMFAAFREINPDTIFGVVLLPTGSWSQDAFGKSYGCGYTRRRWTLNADLLSRKYIQHEKEFGYEVIPAYINNDGENNYPSVEEPAYAGSSVMVKVADNAIHPMVSGYKQWADSEYFFLKYLMANHFKQ